MYVGDQNIWTRSTEARSFSFFKCNIIQYDHDAMPGGINPRHMQQKKEKKPGEDIQQTAAKMMIKIIDK